MTDYSDYPMTIGEAKAEKEQNGGLWTTRDMLVSLLRDIDKGIYEEPEVMFIAIKHKNGEGGFRAAGGTFREVLGTLELSKHHYIHDTVGID